jgi:pyruvate,water dikinase
VYPEYTELLVRAGIDAISVNLDVVDRTRRLIDAAERRVLLDHARSAPFRRWSDPDDPPPTE